MTIEDTIEKASPKVFDGNDLRRFRKKYERAKQNSEKLESIVNLLKETFYNLTGYHRF